MSSTSPTATHSRSRSDRETFAQEFRDAVSPRSLLLAIGTGLLCLGFILSYLGAFHAPTPHELPLAVVAPSQVSGQLTDRLNGIDGSPLDARAVTDEATAQRQLASAEVSGVLVVDPTGTQDELLVASGGGVTASGALTRVVTAAEATQGRTLAVTDAVPHQAGDSSGGSVFYVVLGCVLAGYLLASSVSSARGSRPATFRRTLWRLGTTVPYAVLVGLGGAVITDPVLGAVTGHFGALWAIGALLVLAAATTTIAFQIVFGFLGIAAIILVFVVLGSPSAGGAYPYAMLPAFWRTIGPWLPNGAGTDALRREVYFGGTGTAGPLWVITAWVVGGVVLALVASRLQLRVRTPATDQDQVEA